VVSRLGIQRTADGTSLAGEPGRLSVVIADDHPAYRGQLAIFLRDRGLDVVGEVGDGRAAIELSQAADPDVILMDLRMPLVSGFEAIRRLTRAVPDRRILAISAAALEDEVADAILLGASGHLYKDRPLAELIWGIKAVAAGQPLLTPSTAQVLLRRLFGDADPERSLSGAVMFPRELELLEWLAESNTPTQIAIALLATPEEVNQEIEWLLTKLRAERWIKDAELKGPGDEPLPRSE
jgi:DNA-binding NarL/FixJ family response regulator